MPVKCESRQTKPAAFLTFIPHHKMHPILGNWKGQSANFPVHPINTPQFVTTTWLWNVHLSSSEKIALHTYFLCNNTKRWKAKFCCGNYNECARAQVFKDDHRRKVTYTWSECRHWRRKRKKWKFQKCSIFSFFSFNICTPIKCRYSVAVDFFKNRRSSSIV